MVREKQQVNYSSSSNDEMEVSEDIEESEEERLPSPQSMRRWQGEGIFHSTEITVFDSAKFTSCPN